MSSAVSFASQHTDRSVLAVTVPPQGLAARVGVMAYGVVSYAVGVLALAGLILSTLGLLPFTGGPVQLDSPVGAVVFNLLLLVAFAAQHSVMARDGFKRRWTKIIHPSMERSSYVLATGVFLIPLLWLWQPLGATVWAIETDLLRYAVIALAVSGWGYLFLASFAINHFELFGLQQTWRGFRGLEPVSVPFKERWMYRFDRHPIMTGVLVGLWATPHMSVGHLVLAIGMTLYVMVGVHFEERALRRTFGERYEDYRRRVPTLVPMPFDRD